LACRQAEIAGLVEPIVKDLHQQGIDVKSIDKLVQHHAPLSAQVVQVLLHWLPRIQNDRVKESLIRSLGAAKEPFEGKELIDCFETDMSETLRWPIANTIAEARPFGVADWLVQAVRNPGSGTARQMLVIALARLVPAGQAIPILLTLINDLPGHVAMAIGEIGGQPERIVLQNYSGPLKGWELAEFAKAIKKLGR